MKISLQQATIATVLAGVCGAGLGLLFGEILVASPWGQFLGPSLPGLERLRPVADAVSGGVGASCLAAAMLAIAMFWRGVLRGFVMIGIVVLPAVLVFCWIRIVDIQFVQGSVVWGAASIGACIGIRGTLWLMRPKNDLQPSK